MHDLVRPAHKDIMSTDTASTQETTMTETTERYVDPAVVRDRECRAKRQASLAAVDFSTGRHRDVAARNVKVGMVVDRLVYSYVTDLPEFHLDVVTKVEKSSVIVGGMQITFSDGTSSGFGGDQVFTRTWVPSTTKTASTKAVQS